MIRSDLKQSTGKNRRALYLVAALLLASGAIRIGVHGGSALAKEPDGAPVPDVSLTDDAICDPNLDIATLLQALRKREEEIEKEELALLEKDATLKLAEREIQINLDALRKAEQDLAATMALSETAAENDLSTLTTVYENMKPKEASALFEEMDVDFAAGFLGRMRPDLAASILAGLSAQKAYSISVVLAGRNANAPTE